MTKSLIMVILLLIISLNAVDSASIEKKLQEISDFSGELIQTIPSPMGEKSDTGKIYFSRPNVKIELLGENILIKDDLLYLYEDSSLDGMITSADEMVIFTANPISGLSKNYKVEVTDNQDNWRIIANAKEDMNVMKYIIDIDKQKKVPVYLEKHDITGQITIFKIDNIRFDKVDDVRFEMPDDINFESY
ncbi:MAG: LolA family protein [Candidatus Zixiibacteriota bacterium]